MAAEGQICILCVCVCRQSAGKVLSWSKIEIDQFFVVKVHESSLHRLVTHIDTMFDRAQLPLKRVDASELSSTIHQRCHKKSTVWDWSISSTSCLHRWYLMVDSDRSSAELNAIVPAPIPCFPMLEKGIEETGITGTFVQIVFRENSADCGKVQPQLLRLHRAVSAQECHDQLVACAKQQKSSKKNQPCATNRDLRWGCNPPLLPINFC